MTKIGAKLFRSFVLLCVSLSYTPVVVPQTTTTGAIVGHVYAIGTKAGVSGATVVITNEENGLGRSAATSTNGDFFVGTLPVAFYTISITAPGHQVQTISNFPVRVGQTNPLEVGLTQGSANETVTVKADFEGAILSKSSQISDSFASREIAELPSNVAGGGIDTLALLVPGVVVGVSNVNSNGQAFSVNGNRPRSNNFNIDGQENNDLTIGGPVFRIRNQDLIADYQLITTNPSAQFGRNVGGNINIVTKSGTSDFHGTAFWFHRDQKLFDTLTNIERRSGREEALPLLENVFGGTVGGPIKQDKIFFFGSYQGVRHRESFIARSNDVAILPGELSRLKAAFPGNAAIAALADFSAFAITDFGVVRPRTDISDPFDTIAFARNPNGDSCEFSDPDDPSCIRFRAAFPEREFAIPFDEEEFSARVDMKASEKDNIWVRYLFKDIVSENSLGTSSGFTGDRLDRTHNIGGSWNHQISSRAVNEFYSAYSRLNISSGGGCEGLKGCIPNSKNIGTAFTGIQNLSLSDNFNSLQDIGIFGFSPQGRTVEIIQFADNFSLTRGRHQIITGADIRRLRNAQTFFVGFNGLFTFLDDLDLVNNAPINVSLTAGIPEDGILRFNETDQFYFFQDDWKVRDNLTLNLGLRYEYISQPINTLHESSLERESNAATALWRQSLPLQERIAPKLAGDKNNFAPRVGFAYTPRFWQKVFGADATVIRGGFSILYEPSFYNLLLNNANTAPNVFSNSVFNELDAPIFPLPGVPTGDKVRAFAQNNGLIATDLFDPKFFGQTTVASDLRSPYSEQWSFGFQRQIDKNNIFEVRYVGTHGVGLFQTVNRNPSFARLFNGFTSNVLTDIDENGDFTFTPITFPGFPNLVPAGATPLTCINNPATADNEGACNGRLLPRGAITARENSAQSIYHSLQSRYDGRLFNQVNLGASYTWSKSLDNATEIFDFGFDRALAQNPFDITAEERGYSGLDRRHGFSINGIWDLPWLKEQRGLLGRVLGGWQINGIYLLSSGQRFTPRHGFGPSGYFSSITLRPFNGNPDAPRTSVGITAIDAALVFFEPLQDINAIYSLDELNRTGQLVEVTKNDVRYIFNGPGAALRFGTPFGDVIRNGEVGPKINNLNAGFFKTTRVGEQVKIQFRTEIYNLFNHPNPGYGSFFNGDTVPNTFLTDASREGFAFNDFSDMELNRRIIQFGVRVIF